MGQIETQEIEHPYPLAEGDTLIVTVYPSSFARVASLVVDGPVEVTSVQIGRDGWTTEAEARARGLDQWSAFRQERSALTWTTIDLRLEQREAEHGTPVVASPIAPVVARMRARTSLDGVKLRAKVKVEFIRVG